MKDVRFIDCPYEWQSVGDYDSHKSLLWLALKNTEWDVAEYGCGHSSTPFIDKYCHENGRRFISYENDPMWSDKVMPQYGVRECIKYDLDNLNCFCELVFVDCKPGEIRKDIIERLRNSCKIFVVHDSQESADYVYNLKDVLSTFKYRLNYIPQMQPHTTCISDTVDVEKWVK